ncbi:unnamed protein product [Cylicocyclus nassatus]|uniref:Uncharacterized protein n=1 Tax=Cylicocyclus nassatus TaxID=53992 RepID=A0AA36MC21_CYLNA|nr:unnamed protein product [Cylicocyclus nassatus]
MKLTEISKVRKGKKSWCRRILNPREPFDSARRGAISSYINSSTLARVSYGRFLGVLNRTRIDQLLLCDCLLYKLEGSGGRRGFIHELEVHETGFLLISI